MLIRRLGSEVRAISRTGLVSRSALLRQQRVNSLRRFQVMPIAHQESKVGSIKTKSSSINPEAAERQEETTLKTESPDITENKVPDVTPESLFKDGVLDKDLYRAITKAGFKTFTKVQKETIGPAMSTTKGLVCRAKTGTGKTLAFGIPSLQHAYENINTPRKVQSLIITPTRDLALQIEAELNKIIASFPDRSVSRKLTVATHIGGTKQNNLNPKFTPKIIIATPGRLNANLENSHFLEAFSDLKFRVYDEADRLLDIGFTEELYSIDSKLREATEGQDDDAPFSSLLFSATVDDSVTKFARNVLGKDYQYIDCVDKDEGEAHHLVEQTLVQTKSLADSYMGLLNFVTENLTKKDFKAILFLPTTVGVDFTNDLLKAYFSAQRKSSLSRSILMLHGKKSQSYRDRVVRSFKQARSGLLITTDVAARGLDFKDVTDVIQILPSLTPADYIHKIGRTARAGKSGKSIIFLSGEELKYVKILKDNRKIEFKNVYDYQPNEDFHNKIKEILTDKFAAFDVEDFVKGYMTYIANIKSKYRLRHASLIQELADLHRILIDDELAFVNVDEKFVKAHLSLQNEDAAAIFNHKRRFNDKSSFNKGFKKRFSNDRYDNNRKFDRRGKSDNFFDRDFSNTYRSSYGDRDNNRRSSYSKSNNSYKRNDRNDRY